ncbi:MAG: endolytic transglycosylase MltG [Candidatus Taylorbacteria bacterium]|nr:endolytic transglycosylase MltG [Candidatus Taylorbacteria bacterium]
MVLDPNFLRRLIEQKLAERRQHFYVWYLAVLSLIFLFAAFYVLYLKAPAQFPVRTITTIEQNAGLNAIAQNLLERKIIRSPFWFRVAVILTTGEKGIQAGDYLFEKPAGVLSVMWRLTHGRFGLTPVKVTFPEGQTTTQMSVMLGDELIDFDAKEFLRLAKPKEGYNFPDTYLFLPNVKPQEVVTALQNNFSTRIQSITAPLSAFSKPLKDVVIMASILEAEARTAETRKIIAGILWKRLGLGMPLQVDAPFEYIIGKNTFQLTTEDLQFDSPYNTYLYKGLPPGAIGNPGLDALLAAVTPTPSPYFFYLSDVRGNMHYAKTFEEHVANKEHYLR